MQKTPALLNIICALDCEAKPLIQKYQLKKNYHSTVFALYSNQDQGISLIVSGVGKIKMAASVSYLHQLNGANSFVNIGIAGSGENEVGEVLIAHKIKDSATGITSYPHIGQLKKIQQLGRKRPRLLPVSISPARETRADGDQRGELHFSPLETPSPITHAQAPENFFVKTAELITFDQPQQTYPLTGMMDMEASSFFLAASMFVDQSFIYCMKIISDTHQSQIQAINAKSVAALVTGSLSKIDQIIQQILQLAKQEQKAAMGDLDADGFLKRWHFSQYQVNQLQTMLRRWKVLLPQSNPLLHCQDAKDSKQVLTSLDAHLTQLRYVW